MTEVIGIMKAAMGQERKKMSGAEYLAGVCVCVCVWWWWWWVI